MPRNATSPNLENAFRFAKDIPSLRALARQESRRADALGNLVAALLLAAGPISLKGDVFGPSLGFNLTRGEGDSWTASAAKA